jgi:hypothetical protein
MKPLTMSVAAAALVLSGVPAAHAQYIGVDAPSNTHSDILPRLPNVFRGCWEPLPRHCIRPPGLLWFGDAATLRREHRHRRIRTAGYR